MTSATTESASGTRGYRGEGHGLIIIAVDVVTAWAASAPSEPGASGREASPDDPARGHRGAARASGLIGQARAGARRGRR